MGLLQNVCCFIRNRARMLRVSPQGNWNNSSTFCLAVCGVTAGLQCVWTAPFLLSQFGGVSFYLCYALALLLFGAPLMAAEIWLGRQARCNPVKAFILLPAQAGASRMWRLLGPLSLLISIMVLCYLTVLGGMVLAYSVESANGAFLGVDPDIAIGRLQSYLADPNFLVKWHSLFLFAAVAISAAGIKRGVGFCMRFFLPLAVFLLLIIIAHNVSAGAMRSTSQTIVNTGLVALSGEAVLAACGLALFSLSLGMGAIMACGAYMPLTLSVRKGVLGVIGLTLLFVFLTALAIYPIVTHANIEMAQGPALLFMSLPLALGSTIQGDYYGSLFFVVVTILALSSAVILLEPVTAWLVETFVLPRYMAASIAGLGVWLLGVIVSLSFNDWSTMGLLGRFTPFELLEISSTHLLLPAMIIFNSAFVAMLMKTPRFQQSFKRTPGILVAAWRLHLRYMSPVLIILVAWHALGDKMLS